MNHEQLFIHEQLLQVIEDQTGSEQFVESIRQLAAEHGRETYVELLFILTNIKLQPADAVSLWELAWQHHTMLTAQLQRPVNFSVALLDYLVTEDRYIHRAKIIDLKEYERVAQSAIRDGLTGVYNPGYIREQVSWEIVKDRRYRKGGSIALFDLNKFKQCNDQYGHLAGDAVLKTFAGCLMQFTRRSDAVGRYGGDEFLVLMPATTLEGAFTVADRIRRAFEETAMHTPSAPKEGIHITTSAGISEYRGDRMSGEELIEAADQALYVGKRDGGNRVYVEALAKDGILTIHPDQVRTYAVVPSEETSSLKTIGHLRFQLEIMNPVAVHDLVDFEIILPATREIWRCCGRIEDVVPSQPGVWHVVFRVVERQRTDWELVNHFLWQHDQMHTQEG